MFFLGTGSRPKPLSRGMRQFLEQEFGVSAAYLRPLRHVANRGNFAGQPVKYIRVFDPAAAQAQGVQVTRYQELDDRRALVMFEGKAFRGGRLFLMDHRPRSSPSSGESGATATSTGGAAKS